MALILILITTVLNRARGDDRWKPAWLPGRALFYCAALIGLASLLLFSPRIALAWGTAFLIWGAPAWGYLQLLGRKVDGKEPTPLETYLLEWSAGNVHLALFLRHLGFVGAGFALVSIGLWNSAPGVFAFPFALITLCFYELGWRLTPKQPILTAELLTGALWGATIAGVHYVVQ